MKIGVDARLLCSPITGIGRALIEISKRLSRINPDIFFYVPHQANVHSLLNPDLSAFGESSFGGKIFEHFWSQTYLPYYAKRDEIDVFWGPAHRLPMLLPKSIARVLTIHDLVWITHPGTMNSFGRLSEKMYMPYSLNQADRVMAVSHSTQLALLNEFPKIKEKLSVISLGSTAFPINLDSEAHLRLGIGKKYILFVGTIEPRKNLTRLINAYSRLALGIKLEYDLVLVGRYGWGNVNLPSLTKLLGLSEHVKLLGYVSDEDLATLYRNAVFLAMPSLSEGFGLPILEAMSAGIPVLTSNCSSMPEIAGDAALLVDPFSIDSIQGGLERLLTDPQLRISLSANAHKNSMKYSWDKCAGDLMNLFEEAITSHKVKKI
jgi:glycosyltransferase involved in cell wall biosynthesis